MSDAINESARLEQMRLDDDQRLAFELINGRLTLRGHTWELPVHPHWSVDPFEDPEWREAYQSLTWLAPLRRRALEGDDDARQAWWWLASAWLESLERLETGEGTPWRPEVAATRSIELVAGLAVVSRQPWLVNSLETHLSWFDTNKDIATRPLVLLARFATQRALQDVSPTDGIEGPLYDWHGRHFTSAGAPRVDTRENVSLAIRTLRRIEVGLEQCKLPIPWAHHDHRLSNLNCSSILHEPTVHGPEFSISSVETERALYVVAEKCGVSESFAGIEIIEPQDEIEMNYAVNGQIWLSARLTVNNESDVTEKYLSARFEDGAAVLAYTSEDTLGESDNTRVLYSADTGIALISKTSDVTNRYRSWHDSWTVPPDIKLRKTANSMRLDRDPNTVFILRIPAAPGHGVDSRPIEDELYYWYLGPWNSRMIDILHQPGIDPRCWSVETFSALIGENSTDGDLRPLLESEDWNLAGSRSVLKVDQPSATGTGFLALVDPEDQIIARSRELTTNRGYLSLIDVPDGGYQVVWTSNSGQVHSGPAIDIKSQSLSVTE